jgi:hypothetical protein
MKQLVPPLAFGRTLARRGSQDAAFGVIATAIQHGHLRGQVTIAVVTTEHPDRLDVEAAIEQLPPELALDALQIASARIGILHRRPASQALALSAQDSNALRLKAEQLVDECRAFGWWETVCGVARFFGVGADFMRSRDHCVRQVMHALGEQRLAGMPIAEPAEAAE